MNEKDHIEFKGTKDGLVVYLNDVTDFETIKVHLIEKLEKTKQFFKGAKVGGIEGKSLTESQEHELIDLMDKRYGMIISVKENLNFHYKEEIFEGLNEGITKFVKMTMRSGNKVEFKGNIVVMGDINPGAEVIAQGNIVVMGSLRGIAHAGSNGNENAFVSAFKLQPTQLRISKIIARSPDSSSYKPKYPEIAFIKDEMIVIEPYLTKNKQEEIIR